MCIVIDTNCFTHVFSRYSENHSEFKPVLDWLMDGRGKIVYGGTKYQKELSNAGKFIPIITELKRRNKVVRLSDEKVDEWEREVKKKLESDGKDHINDERYNDPHLVAIFSISGCKLLCSTDKKSFPFLNDKRYYIKDRKPPRFYTAKRNINLLCDKYFGSCCE